MEKKQELKTTVTSPSGTERHLEIEVPRERFSHIFDGMVKKYSKELDIKGFRKGSVPRRLIAERFQEPITNESLEKVVENAIKEVCEEYTIKPVAPGKVQHLKNEEGNPIQIKAVIEVEQDVEFTNYTNLGITPAPQEEVTEDFIRQQVEAYCKSMAKEEKKDGPGAEGDIAVGEYLEILIDGESQNLDKQKSFRVEIGLDDIKEFNEAFSGACAGEEKEIAVTYPDTYQVPELAGKTGFYRVKIMEILGRTIPEASDELARQYGSRDLEDLKNKIRRNEEEYRAREARNRAEAGAVEKIIEAHPFEIPAARIQQYKEYRQQQMGEKEGRISERDSEVLEKEAVYYLKRFRIIEQIAKKEKIKATQAEVDQRITELAQQNGMEFDKLKASLRQSGRINDLREELKTKKTFDFILGIQPPQT